MAVGNAVEAMELFLTQLRVKGVRSFKGDLLRPNGTKMWTFEVVFEPERPENRSREDEKDPWR